MLRNSGMSPMPSGNRRMTSSVTPGRMVGLIMPTTPRQLENTIDSSSRAHASHAGLSINPAERLDKRPDKRSLFVLVFRNVRMVFTLDTLGYAKHLRDSGVPANEAEAHAEAARDFIMAELVTKTDLE